MADLGHYSSGVEAVVSLAAIPGAVVGTAQLCYVWPAAVDRALKVEVRAVVKALPGAAGLDDFHPGVLAFAGTECLDYALGADGLEWLWI